MGSPYITDDVKHSLTSMFEKLNPFDLRKAIEDKLKKIFKTCFKKNHHESALLRQHFILRQLDCLTGQWKKFRRDSGQINVIFTKIRKHQSGIFLYK